MRNKLQFKFIFIGLAILSISRISAVAQGIGDRNIPRSGGSHIISGSVNLPDGSPAKGVKVYVGGADFTNTSVTTDRDGKYMVGGLPAGNYEISVKEDGYEKASETMTIDRFAAVGQGYHVSFQLRAARTVNTLLNNVPSAAVAKFQKGMEKVTSDPKAAIGFFDEAIAAYPNFAAAYFEKGAALLKTNDIDRALESFVKAIQLKPDYVEAKYSYGYAEYLKKNYEVAAAVFDDVLKQRSDMPEAHMYLGISLFYLKNVDAAESHLKMATAKESGERVALAHRFLGGIYMQKKQNGPAAAELQKYVDLVPKAPDADKLRATIADLKKQG